MPIIEISRRIVFNNNVQHFSSESRVMFKFISNWCIVLFNSSAMSESTLIISNNFIYLWGFILGKNEKIVFNKYYIVQ